MIFLSSRFIAQHNGEAFSYEISIKDKNNIIFMNTTQIVLTILSSSVLSAMLTSYFNWRIHNSNYKKDYYKKILDKRLDAYEEMNVLIKRLSDVVYTDRGFVHGMFSGEESFGFLLSIHHSIMEKSYWLSDKTSHKLTEFGVFLFNSITSNLTEGVSQQVDEEYIKLALANFEQIQEFNQILKEMINSDLQYLYDVDEFFSKNGKDSKTYPLFERTNKKM